MNLVQRLKKSTTVLAGLSLVALILIAHEIDYREVNPDGGVL